MLISIMLTSLGYVYVYRILGSSLKKIGLFNYHAHIFLSFVVLMLISFIFLGPHPIWLWLSFGTIFLFIKSSPQIFFRYMETLIQRHTLRILDHMVLGVQSGHSLRVSLAALAAQESSLLRVSLHNLFHAIEYDSAPADLGTATLARLFEELMRIEKSQSKCADQLRALRKRVKTIEDFRRRSGQVTMQIRMQAAISALLYLGLLAFMISQFGFFAYRGLILLSGSLFLSGLVTVFVIGRRVRWNT